MTKKKASKKKDSGVAPYVHSTKETEIEVLATKIIPDPPSSDTRTVSECSIRVGIYFIVRENPHEKDSKLYAQEPPLTIMFLSNVALRGKEYMWAFDSPQLNDIWGGVYNSKDPRECIQQALDDGKEVFWASDMQKLILWVVERYPDSFEELEGII
jgi:hypothetical protein